MSLTRKLVLLITTTVSLITLLAAGSGFMVSDNQLEELFDAELAQNTRVVQGLMQHMSDNHPVGQLSETLARALELPDSVYEADNANDEILADGAGHRYERKIAFELWSPDGEPVLDTLGAPDTGKLEPGFAWQEVGGFRWRTFTLKDPETGFWIRSAQREDVRDELSQEIALGNVLPFLIALPLLVLAVVGSIQLGFVPLRRLEKPVRHMAPERIHPLDDQQAPREVVGLVHAVNGLLRRLDQALERERRFSADAAHELRTPLTALRLSLEKLGQDHPGEFDNLTAAVDRMVHLVEQMLLLNRVDAGGDFRPVPEDVSALVEQSIADVAPLALRKQVEPELESAAGLPAVSCHSALIATMLRSLLANAIQYSPAGTRITTTLAQKEGGVIIAICDQGPGIPPEERERALSRFTRLDQRQGAGAGLGLAIARRIAELHQGSLSLSGRGDGKPGLRVNVWLPVRQTLE
ncbi:ATP-binding protein [Marinobacter oulmenensis]|uniref:histidine kinase n=1 Tax=Marinobacter oulmenensis TaxID=643747 RepID=A0A840UCL0_9GAMM|nr:ATP-binding protein [Marinobacter oulmenensis]MBB5321040.1 two-component system sensor histidine kinase QseC [Marinobacter oulmenensis]